MFSLLIPAAVLFGLAWLLCANLGLLVVPDAAALVFIQDLTNSTTHAGKLSGTLTVKLYQNNVPLTRSVALAAFTEATFTGYIAATIATPHEYLDPVLGPYILWPTATFTVGSSVTITNTIYGVYILDGGGNLLWAESFATPVVMTTTGQAINYVAVLGDVSQAG